MRVFAKDVETVSGTSVPRLKARIKIAVRLTAKFFLEIK